MKPNLVETLLHHGFDYFKQLINWLWRDLPSYIFNYLCFVFSKQALEAMMRYLFIICVSFIFGILASEHMIKKHIFDDCRILQSTRFDQQFIKCSVL